MGNFLSFDAVYVAIMFVIPGHVMLWFRSHFIISRKSDAHTYYITALTLSALNFAVSGWAIYLAIAYNISAIYRLLVWSFVIVISPAIIGFFSGIGSKNGWLRWVYNKVQLSPIHVIPTSWDYQFSQLTETWILVVLKDNTTFAGYWAGRSFASSTPEERDLLIEQVFSVSEEGEWTPTEKSVYIGPGEIRTIEFIPIIRSENDRSKRQKGTESPKRNNKERISTKPNIAEPNSQSTGRVSRADKSRRSNKTA